MSKTFKIRFTDGTQVAIEAAQMRISAGVQVEILNEAGELMFVAPYHQLKCAIDASVEPKV